MWGTGIIWLITDTATLPQGYQELLVVKDKVGRPQVSLGKQVHGMWYFPFSALTLLVGWQEGYLACKKLGVSLLVVTIWLELCTTYSSSCHHHFHSVNRDLISFDIVWLALVFSYYIGIAFVRLQWFFVLYCSALLSIKSCTNKFRMYDSQCIFKFCCTWKFPFLGRLPKVDLIILEGKNVRTSVRPQKVYSIWMKFGI